MNIAVALQGKHISLGSFETYRGTAEEIVSSIDFM